MLEKYEGRYIRVRTKDGQSFSGLVGDYVEPIHNDNGIESIIIDDTERRRPIEIYQNEIQEIEILK